MSYSNLPPGVTDADLPGNRPIDEWSDVFWENLDSTVLAATEESISFKDRVISESEDYGLDADPVYAAQQVSERLIEEAEEILDEL